VHWGGLLVFVFWLLSIGQVSAQPADKKTAESGPKPADKSLPAYPSADVKVMKALASTMRVSFKNTPMKLVLEQLEDKAASHGLLLPIIVDERGLKDAGIEPALFFNNPVTKEFKSLKVRSLLRMILDETGMGYYIENGNLIITKDAKALAKTVSKAYPVDNLVGGRPLVDMAAAECAMGKFGPIGKLLNQNIDRLKARVMGEIEPDYWRDLNPNGPGSMAFAPSSASLQVRASLEVQYLIIASGLLDDVAAPLDLKAVSVKVYSVAGILDPKNMAKSIEDLQAALALQGIEVGKPGDPTLVVILGHAEALVARLPLEVHIEIEQMLFAIRNARNFPAAMLPTWPASRFTPPRPASPPAVLDLSGIDLDEVRR